MTIEHTWDEKLGNWQALNDAQRRRPNPLQQDVASETLTKSYPLMVYVYANLKDFPGEESESVWEIALRALKKLRQSHNDLRAFFNVPEGQDLVEWIKQTPEGAFFAAWRDKAEELQAALDQARLELSQTPTNKDTSDALWRFTVSERIRDIYIACARASCPKCAEGYTVIRSSAVGAFVHLADLQPKNLPPIYFDQVCQATHIWALDEAENESQAHAPQA